MADLNPEQVKKLCERLDAVFFDLRETRLRIEHDIAMARKRIDAMSAPTSREGVSS
jgi:hypothetical protein